MCNPNLRPKTIGKNNWRTTPTQASIELKGKWTVKSGDESQKITLEENAAGNTVLKTVLSQRNACLCVVSEIVDQERDGMNMKKLLSILMLSWAFVYGQAQQSVDMDWWREGRFGMFIHWGLYSVAAGEWNGKPVDGIGEWIQNFAKVPNNEYEKLADKLTLAKYNPEEWVKLAKASRSSLYCIYD